VNAFEGTPRSGAFVASFVDKVTEEDREKVSVPTKNLSLLRGPPEH